ncbi:MAG TPA: c-type cytochrome [Burkholderiales bacterium]|nr:c-type cytochrome [Burkholderiales bacterium]
MDKLLAIIAMLVLLPCAALAQDAAAGKEKAAVCGACHGADGNSTVPQYPILAGQNARYIYIELRDFKEGRRKDPQMSPMAANLSKKDMLDLAAYFSGQKFSGQNSKGDTSLVAKGKEVADAALCTMCHLGGFSGQNEIPKAGGQHYDYVLKQLQDFKAKRRTNDAGNMTAVLRTIADDDLKALAAYVASLD